MVKLNRHYGLDRPLEEAYPMPIIASRAPTTGDKNFTRGQLWVYTTTNMIYGLTDVVAGNAQWSLLGPGASDVDTLTGDAGGAIPPAGGNITLAGGTNIGTTGAGNTITFNLDPAITLATSVTSPSYLSAAAMAITSGAAIDINAAAGSNVTIQLGDAGGVNVLEIEDSASATVATINSNGVATFVGMDGIIGGVTPAGATFTTAVANTSVTSPLFTAAAADAVVQAGGANDVVVRLGDAAGATFFRVQSSTPADVFTIDSTGVFGALAGLSVTGAFTQTAGVVNMGTDAAANAINIGTGAAAKVVSIGSTNGASSLTERVGTGNYSLDGVAASTYNIGASTVAGTVTIGGTGQTGNFVLAPSTAALTASFANLNGTKSIDIGNGIDGNTISIGNGANTSAQIVNIGGGASAANSTVNILSGNVAAGTSTLNIATGTGGKTVHIADGAGVNLVTVGSTNGASSMTVQSGTAGIAVNATGAASPLTIDSVGVLELNSSAGIISIGNDAVAQNINIGTGGAARLITIGNATGATSLAIDVGTGNLDIGVTATAHQTSLGSTTGASATIVQSGTGGIQVNATGAASPLDIDCVGAMQINSSGGTIGIGNDAVAQNMNIGTGAAARTITIGNVTGATSVVVDTGTGAASFGASATAHTTTIGSTTGASATIIQSGTGDITVTGTVKEIDAEFLSRSGDDITITQSPIMQSNLNTGAAPSGATGDVNLMMLQEGIIMEQFIIGAGQTIIAPRMDANGLLVSLDLVATEGAEYNFGAARTNSRHAYTIGTSPAFYFECRFRIADMSGADPIVFGFRKSEANNATLANYTDYACIGMNATTSATQVVTITELNGGGQTITNTTDNWVGGDGGTNTLQVLVSAAGVVTYTINGAAPSVPAAFTFDNGDVVCPFFHFVHGAAAPGAIEIVSMKIGYQA